MRRGLGALLICVALLAACAGGSHATPKGTSALVDIGQGLKGPSGLSATVYATTLTHAAAFAFDGSHQLWVATADYSDSGQDAVYVVKSAGEGTTKAIDGLHTPLGLLWYGEDLYVAAKESITKYSGFDGTTFASHTTVVSFPSGVGEVNGIALAPDGRMQVGISAPCDHCTTTIEDSASIVSFLPDGSDLRVDASGIRAPIELEYYPGTDDLFVTMNQRDDLGDDTPGDWLAVVPQGSKWGFPDCYGQGGDACAGVPTAIAELDQHAAVSGLAFVTGQLQTVVGNVALVAEWANGIVQGVTLTVNVSTYSGTVAPFLTGFKNPVALIVGPDNAIYVSDWTTGIVYRIAKG